MFISNARSTSNIIVVILNFFLLALASVSVSEADPIVIPQNPTLTINVPGVADILTYNNGGTILRCCGTKVCVQCEPLDFDPKKNNGKLPVLKEGQILRLSHISEKPEKALYLCPDVNNDTLHQCREINIDKQKVNPQ